MMASMIRGICLSEDLSVVTLQCSVIVRDFVLWCVDRATHGHPW